MESIQTAIKYKLDFDEMIVHMEEKCIKFNIIDKDNAKRILQESNYFFKLLSYRKNFDKDHKGEYINLEFGLLSDLATIDMRLRYIVLQMCLDIEHNVKTKMLKDITNDNNEDGYTIVSDFFNHCHASIDDLLQPLKRESNYNFGIYNTYGDNPPVWVLFEIISFGWFVRFVEFYFLRTNKSTKYKNLFKVLKYIKNIRNSSAHNSPLLMDIVRKNQLKVAPEHFVTSFVKKVSNISKDVRRKRLTNRKTHDLTVLFSVHYTYIKSAPMKKARYKDLRNLMDRTLRYKSYYGNHDGFVSTYNYFNKIVDFLNQEL